MNTWIQIPNVIIYNKQHTFHHMLLKQSSQDHRNNSNKIEIRFALTGHTEHWDNILSIDHIKEKLRKQYKIELADQKMITKNGHILQGHQKLSDTAKFQKSFSSKVPQSMNIEKCTCIYLYDHRELLARNNQDVQDLVYEHEAKQLLNSRLEAGIGLRNNIFQLKSVENSFSEEQENKIIAFSPTIKEMLDLWFVYLIDFFNQYEIIKETTCFLEQYTRRFQNQRRSHITLVKALTTFSEANIVHLKNFCHKIEKKKPQNSISTSSLQRFQSMKNKLYGQINDNRSNIVNLKNQSKKFYHDNEKAIKNTDEYSHKKAYQLEKISKQLIRFYTEFVQTIKQWLFFGVEDKLLKFLQNKNIMDKQFSHNAQECKNISDELSKKFVSLYKIYSQSILEAKRSYKKYIELQNQQNITVKKIQNFEKQTVAELQQNIPVQMQNSKRNQGKSPVRLTQEQRENIEIQRRQNFNYRLLAIQEELKIFIKEEQKQRKFFVADILSNQQNLINQALQNINTPCFLLNYDETTDQQFLKKSSSTSLLQSIDFYRPTVGLQKILQELQSIKNCQLNYRKQQAISTKIKNLKGIIEKSAGIFQFVYLEKSKQQEKKYESTIKLLNTRNATLEREISDLRKNNEYYLTEMTKYKKQMQDNQSTAIHQQQQIQQLLSKIQTLQTQISSLTETNQQLTLLTNNLNITDPLKKQQISQQIPQLHQKIQNLELQVKNLKKKEKQLKQTNEDLSKKVMDQLGLIEPIVCELENERNKVDDLGELIMEYKGVMGDQEIKITRLEIELSEYKNKNVEKGNMNSNQLLEQEAMNNKKIINNTDEKQMNACFYNQNNQLLNPDFQSLQQQLQELRAQKQELQEENEHLNEELMKIMMKDTEDVETQTPEEESKQQSIIQKQKINQAVILNQEVEVGQLRVLIPFGSGHYIVANPSDSHLQTNYLTNRQLPTLAAPYFLDLNCLSTKSRQLLHECSLVVLARITRILPATDKYYVEAELQSALGFEDDDFQVRDYVKYLG